ncbi:MAG: hypothetical protein FJ294_05600 [Planctomycetes bacterium]|nr:hypothetical protein [Planctomycetota bacterium]
MLRGSLPSSLEVHEEGLVCEVDLLHGHKTGHQLDQRANRMPGARLARGRAILDMFCFDGLFAIRAAIASSTCVRCGWSSPAATWSAPRVPTP